MNKIKTRFITITACFALLALLIGLAVGALTPVTAGAITVRPSSLFWGMSGGEVRAYADSREHAEGEDSYGYVTLILAENDHKEGSVEYRKNLALKWYLPVNEDPTVEEGEEAPAIDRSGELQYFGLTFSFPEVNFETFTLTFSGAEENVTKEGKSANQLIFKNTSDGFYAFLKDSSLQDDEHKDFFPDAGDPKLLLIDEPTKDLEIKLSEGNCNAGEFLLTINGKTVGENSKLTNVGGEYLEYRTSSTPNVPLTFKAVMPENATKSQKVLMKKLNGQTMKVTGGTATEENGKLEQDDKTVLYEGGSVVDDAPPALIFNQKIYAFTLGQRYDLSPTAIDVCDDSLSTSRYYYMAKKVDDMYAVPELKKLTDENGYKSLYTTTYFVPTQESPADSDEVEYVSIRFTVDDGRDDASTKWFYYLDWYADKSEGANVVKEQNGFNYIRIDKEKQAPYYTIITPEVVEETNDAGETVKVGKNTQSKNYEEAVKAYQDQLDAAAEKVSAGDGAYFYLPSLRDLIESKSADYRNLRFNIYYYKPGVAEGSSASSETSLRYNNLRFEIEEPGTYKFRVMASDSAGNTMQMYLDDGNETPTLTTLTATNIWDVEEIPDFTIEIGYTGAVIEPVEDNSIGYRGSSYSITSFDIIAYGNSKRDYTLYYMDEAKINEKGMHVPTVAELNEDAAKYLNDERYNGAADNDPCFIEIRKYNSDISKEDEDAWNRTDNDYNWNPGTTPGSFTPQKSGRYIVKLVLTDTYLANKQTVAYQTIDIRNPSDITPGQIDWLKNNVTSVVLFAISAVLAVAIVVLFVVKPSEKNVEEVDLEKLKGKNKSKKK